MAKNESYSTQHIRDNLTVSDIHHSFMLPQVFCQAALGVEHLHEQVVAGHLTVQVFAVQVVFSEGAERA